MSYADVMHFWCSPFDCYKIREEDLTSSITPIIIEGARGSGKTMILKHLSFFCQKENFTDNKIIDGISTVGYLGIYFRYSADYSTLFDTLNCSKTYQEYLFDNYFQLSISLEIAHILQDVEDELTEQEKNELFFSISSLYDNDITNTKEFVNYIEKSIQKLDAIIRRSQYLDIDENLKYQEKTILFELIKLVQTCIQRLKNTLFIIIIDEYENVGDYQRVINTYIKQMDGQNKYTFRKEVKIMPKLKCKVENCAYN